MKLSSIRQIKNMPPEQLFLGLMLVALVLFSFLKVKEGMEGAKEEEDEVKALTQDEEEMPKKEKRKVASADSEMVPEAFSMQQMKKMFK